MNQDFTGLGGQPGPDIKRLFLAGLLMSAVLMVFSHFFAPSPQKPSEAKATVAQTQAPAAAPEKAIESAVAATPESIPLSRSDFKIPVVNAFIEHDPAWPKGGYQLETQNLGANIGELSVFGYKEPLKLVAGERSGMFFLKSRSKSATLAEDAAYEIVSSSPEEIVYQRVTPEGFRVVKRYQFTKDNYVLRHEVEVTNTAPNAQRIDLDVIVRTDGKAEEGGYFSPPVHELNFLASKDHKIERHPHGDYLNKSINVDGPLDFVAFEQRYFLVSVIPKASDKVAKVTAHAEPLENEKNVFQAAVTVSLKAVELEPNATMKWEFESYVGPKQMALLKQVGHGLDDAINYGWFGVISRPLLWLLVQIFGLVHNFGLAIILLTLLIKILTFPLTQKSFVSMQQVKKIGPEIKALEKKYGHDRTTLSQKQMELYKEKGVNPMAGCLPMFLQFPVWIALYQMLSNSIEIYQKPFALWLTDLTQPDPYYVLPILMGISMVIQQLLQPVQDDQKAMKYAMLGTSVLFTFIMLNLPSGLSLYMFTNNILTLIQQMLIKRRFDASVA